MRNGFTVLVLLIMCFLLTGSKCYSQTGTSSGDSSVTLTPLVNLPGLGQVRCEIRVSSDQQDLISVLTDVFGAPKLRTIYQTTGKKRTQNVFIVKPSGDTIHLSAPDANGLREIGFHSREISLEPSQRTLNQTSSSSTVMFAVDSLASYKISKNKFVEVVRGKILGDKVNFAFTALKNGTDGSELAKINSTDATESNGFAKITKVKAVQYKNNPSDTTFIMAFALSGRAKLKVDGINGSLVRLSDKSERVTFDNGLMYLDCTLENCVTNEQNSTTLITELSSFQSCLEGGGSITYDPPPESLEQGTLTCTPSTTARTNSE